MSWVITEIGGLKDAGLQAEAMHEIDRELGTEPEHTEPPKIAKIVSEIVRTFIVENNCLRDLSEDIAASVE